MQVEGLKDEENRKVVEEGIEGDFWKVLNVNQQDMRVIQMESITLFKHATAEGCFWEGSPTPKAVAAALCIGISLRHKEDIKDTHILNLQHMSGNELEEGLKEKEKELNKLLGLF